MIQSLSAIYLFSWFAVVFPLGQPEHHVWHLRPGWKDKESDKLVTGHIMVMRPGFMAVKGVSYEQWELKMSWEVFKCNQVTYVTIKETDVAVCWCCNKKTLSNEMARVAADGFVDIFRIHCSDILSVWRIVAVANLTFRVIKYICILGEHGFSHEDALQSRNTLLMEITV